VLTIVHEHWTLWKTFPLTSWPELPVAMFWNGDFPRRSPFNLLARCGQLLLSAELEKVVTAEDLLP